MQLKWLEIFIQPMNNIALINEPAKNGFLKLKIVDLSFENNGIGCPNEFYDKVYINILCLGIMWASKIFLINIDIFHQHRSFRKLLVRSNTGPCKQEANTLARNYRSCKLSVETMQCKLQNKYRYNFCRFVGEFYE